MEKIKSTIDNKDYMRMAMLKHEETFKEQVYELHRLYRMQKMLMQSVRTNQQKQGRFLVDSNNKGFTIDYNHQEAVQRGNNNILTNGKSHHGITGLNGPENDQVLRPSPITRPNSNNVSNNTLVLDESEIELTLSLGPSAHNPRRRRTDSGHESLSSSSTGSSQTRKKSPKSNGSSLLAIGDQQFTWGSSTNFPQGADLEPGFSNGPPNNSPWLFQGLSLKST
ncbi:hypothetical protein vseg_005248 [Gypsophila vaccaria]